MQRSFFLHEGSSKKLLGQQTTASEAALDSRQKHVGMTVEGKAMLVGCAPSRTETSQKEKF